MSDTRITLTENEVCALLHCLDLAIKNSYDLHTARHRRALLAIRDRIDADGEPK